MRIDEGRRDEAARSIDDAAGVGLDGGFDRRDRLAVYADVGKLFVGQDAALEKNRAALTAIAAAGHEIGNHSFRHEPWLHLYTTDELEQELRRAEDAIEAATGTRPRGFRGPGFSLSEGTLETLCRRGYDYDATVFPVRREAYLRAWLAMPDAHGLAVVHGADVVGYGLARRCRVGVKVGPLFADDAATAEALYAGLAAWAGDRPISLDVPEPNAAAVALAERHRLVPVFETARMYRGEAPDEPVERIFGVTTFELG